MEAFHQVEERSPLNPLHLCRWGEWFQPLPRPIASSTGMQMLSMKEGMKTGDSFKHLLAVKQKDCVKAQTLCFLAKSWTPKLQWLMKWQTEKGRICSMPRWMKAACATGSAAAEILPCYLEGSDNPRLRVVLVEDREHLRVSKKATPKYGVIK